MTLNPTIDITMTTPRLISEGKNRARRPIVHGGGGGINVARGIRRLGGSALALHTRGREPGRYLDRLLDEEDLPHRGVDIDGDTRTAFIVAEEWTGHSYHVVPPGPELGEADQQRFLEAVAATAPDFAYLVLTGSATPRLREDFCADIVRAVADTGTEVILDITAPQLRKVLMNEVFLIRLDRDTAGSLIGRPIESFDDARATNDYLLDAGATAHAITTVGALGAVYSTPEAHYELSAPVLASGPHSDACAGDSLIATVVHRLTRGDTCVRACAYGVAAAAATVALPGAEMFARDDVETLHAAVGVSRTARRG
ncbi:PfkB family carbohydrate kinase [Nocardia sp.]|uniref:1-phosphofructokinase family hexose kinase n=1 Tax=Nocardia sp. TaxID=1821 RepID=UPI00258DE80E|nr:PfkB family carbohydrate kinase [Nocardia sp.]